MKKYIIILIVSLSVLAIFKIFTIGHFNMTQLAKLNIEALSSIEEDMGMFKVAERRITTEEVVELHHITGTNTDAVVKFSYQSVACEGKGNISCTPGIPENANIDRKILSYVNCTGKCIKL